jgi:HSP20 family protein
MKLIRYEYPQLPSTSAFNRLFDLGTPAFERFGSLFDDFFGTEAVSHHPAADLYEDDANYYARIELPGVKRDKIDLQLENAVLTVRTHETKETESEQRSYSYERSLSVPDGVKLEELDATYADGVLTVTMPKEVAVKPRRIDVK